LAARNEKRAQKEDADIISKWRMQIDRIVTLLLPGEA
jgi:hypothetical protein